MDTLILLFDYKYSSSHFATIYDVLFSAGLIDLFDENGVNFDLQQDELTPEEEPEKTFEDLVSNHVHTLDTFVRRV